MTHPGPWAYGAIYLAAILEGEVVFVAASVLVAIGQLSVWPVLLAGALGAATGDQLYFYALRGRVERWTTRIRLIACRHDAIVARVQRHQALMILSLRFAPGLRIAIAAACAYARVSPLKFSLVNVMTAFVWASILLVIVTALGPAAFDHLGFRGLWGALVPAILIVAFGWWLGSRQRADGG